MYEVGLSNREGATAVSIREQSKSSPKKDGLNPSLLLLLLTLRMSGAIPFPSVGVNGLPWDNCTFTFLYTTYSLAYSQQVGLLQVSVPDTRISAFLVFRTV